MATIEKTITIDAPAERLYAIWTNPQMFPRFMENVEEVSLTGPNRTHWRMNGPLGKTLEWDAVTTEQVPNSVIAWKSVEGSGNIENEGRVTLKALGPNQTEATVALGYSDTPGGKVGEVVTAIIQDPDRRLSSDLERLKKLAEGRDPNE
jgi:uncharacterized membrane protein